MLWSHSIRPRGNIHRYDVEHDSHDTISSSLNLSHYVHCTKSMAFAIGVLLRGATIEKCDLDATYQSKIARSNL